MIEGLQDILKADSSRVTKMDCTASVEEYINKSDWRINANANTGYSSAGLVNNLAGKAIANYWLDRVYSKKEGDAHRNGDYHIHDLDCLQPYCFTEDTKIKTVDFGNITIKELLEKNVSTFTVVSFDGEKVVECNAHDLRCTRKDAELVEVEFEDGVIVRCTPDHKFLSLTPETNPETHEAYLKVEWKPAAYLTMKTVRKAYTCPIIKSDVIKLEEVEGVITESDAKNSFVKVISVKHLDYKEDVYCVTVDNTHCFALENGVIAHNCCGHDLQTLLQEGFNGVVSRVSSKPPKHFREALGQMANFIGILQSEWAGAQAFSSFDTLLAPYVFFDMMVEGITKRDVKKALLSFVYNLNVPSRWGQCVNSSYKCLRGDGKWVSHDELKVGDVIYVVDVETGALKKDVVTHVNVFDAPQKMHHYYNEQGFNFDVTPNHRVIYKTGSNPFTIKPSSELIGKKSPIYIPISSWNTPTPENFMSNEYNITDELLELITFIMCDGCIVKQEGKTARIEFYKSPNRYGCDRFEELCAILGVEYSVTTNESAKFEGSYCNKYRLMNSDVTKTIIDLLGGDKHKCPDFMKYLSPRQAYIVLDTWVLLDGHFDGCHWKMQADNKEIQEMLAYLTILSGKSVSLTERLIGENKNATIYTNIHKRGCRSCSVTEIDARTDKVWCPTTNTGTFVCMTDEGYVFFTGNSPFSNVTIDMTVPQTMRFLSPQRGNEPYFVRNWREFLEAENLTDNPDEALKRNEGWNRLIEEARKRIGDYDSDEETILYSLTYQHFAPEMMIINKAYYEILSEGDCEGQPFTFPIPTVNITEDFDWDNPEYDFLFENAARYGSSYFQNFIGSQYLRDENGNLTIRDENAYSPNDLRSMCCRLQLSKKALRKRGGGLFGSDAQTGSIGVVTINMARLGYLYKGDIKGLYKRLTVLMDMARSTLDKKRAFVEEMYLRGLYPYTRRYVKTYDTYFSTIGVNGMNEMVRNFTNDEYDITDERGQKMCMEILDFMNKKMEAYQEDGKALWNLEATPAEGCLHFDTKILTIDGPKKIGELSGEQVPVLSYNKDTKELEYKNANVFLDSITEKVYKITFDNGYSLECTSEHPFAVRHWNGKSGEEMYWSPASALKVGDRIKSVYPRVSLHGYKKYGKNFFEHRGVYEFYKGEIPEGHVIHHKDGDKFNNSIENLVMMTDSEHKAYHIKEMMNNGVIEVNNSGENNNFYGKNHTSESKLKIGDARCRLTDAEKDAIIEAYSAGLEFKQMSRMFGMTTLPMDFIRRIGLACRESYKYPKVNKSAIEYLYYKGYEDEQIVDILRGHNTIKVVRDVILSLQEENHKVTSIEILHKKMPVYNASVEDNRNFYVGDEESGYVLTHNTTTRFAREDIKRYPDIIQAGFPDAPYYTNSSQLPVDFSSDVFSTLDLQDELQKKYTGGCVEAGNYVITDRGRILIDELCNNPDKYKGIKVISYNTSTNSSEWDLVTDFHKIDVSQKDKIHVVGNGGLDIVTSDWHPFFVVTDDGTVVEKRADELKKNDYVLCNSTVMFDDSDKELTPELAYVIGFYIGDGSMSLTHDNRGGNNIPKHNVRFHHSNEDRIKRLENILRENGLCSAKARRCDKRSKNLMCIGTTKKSMYEFLNKYGFTDGEKSKTVHFSDTLKSQLNKKNAFALLSGLFDTDAHIDPITDDMEYFTASEELAKDIVYLCSMLGIKCSYSIKNDKRYDHSHYRLYIPAKSLYEVEDELMSLRKPTGVSKDKVSHKSIIKNNYNVVRVTDVSKCDVDDNVFYDLTTENNHNYLCGKRNYVFIHNTVLHIYNDEDVTAEECKLLLKKVLTNYRLPYVSFTATFSSCPKHGRISGIHEYCPLCDKELMQKHLSEIDLNKA